MAEQAKTDAAFLMYGIPFPSEKDAILALLAGVALEETAAGVAIGKWAAITKDPELRGGLRIISEREAYHGRVFKQRLNELGGAKTKPQRDPSIKAINDSLPDPTLSDQEKLDRLHAYSPDPEALLKPLKDFAHTIKDDPETREALLLYYQDEISSGTWLCGMRGTLMSRKAPTPAHRTLAA